MRGQNRNESFVLKHRLTGAAILIGFAVVVLPMLLGGPDPAGNGPEAPGTRDGSNTKVFESNIKPIGGEVPSVDGQPAEQADGGENASQPAVERETRVTAAGDGNDGGAEGVADEEETAAADQAGDAATGSEPAETIERGWIVQIGTFKNPDNVRKLVTELENGGFGTSTTEVETSEGVATRVWVGPFETRVEAARTKTRVKQRTGSEGLIVAYP